VKKLFYHLLPGCSKNMSCCPYSLLLRQQSLENLEKKQSLEEEEPLIPNTMEGENELERQEINKYAKGILMKNNNNCYIILEN
jgi:hypothetical protein